MGPPNEYERDPFRRPHVRKPLRCRLGWHKWRPLPVRRHHVVRMCVGRRGCSRCGLVQMRTVHSAVWRRWGWVRPEHVRLSIEEWLDLYLPSHRNGPAPERAT